MWYLKTFPQSTFRHVIKDIFENSYFPIEWKISVMFVYFQLSKQNCTAQQIGQTDNNTKILKSLFKSLFLLVIFKWSYIIPI